MQTVEVVRVCDPCEADGKQVPGREVRVSLDGAKPRRLDLCDRHRSALVEPLASAVKAHGVLWTTNYRRTRPTVAAGSA